MTGVDVIALAKQAVEPTASAASLSVALLQQYSTPTASAGLSQSIRTQSMTMFRSTRETYGLHDVPSPTKASRRTKANSATSLPMTGSVITAVDMDALYPGGDGGDVIAESYQEKVNGACRFKRLMGQTSLWKVMFLTAGELEWSTAHTAIYANGTKCLRERARLFARP